MQRVDKQNTFLNQQSDLLTRKRFFSFFLFFLYLMERRNKVYAECMTYRYKSKSDTHGKNLKQARTEMLNVFCISQQPAISFIFLSNLLKKLRTKPLLSPFWPDTSLAFFAVFDFHLFQSSKNFFLLRSKFKIKLERYICVGA
jgi:hypothetical protein